MQVGTCKVHIFNWFTIKLCIKLNYEIQSKWLSIGRDEWHLIKMSLNEVPLYQNETILRSHLGEKLIRCLTTFIYFSSDILF
jgi:hypothetical protein